MIYNPLGNNKGHIYKHKLEPITTILNVYSVLGKINVLCQRNFPFAWRLLEEYY